MKEISFNALVLIYLFSFGWIIADYSTNSNDTTVTGLMYPIKYGSDLQKMGLNGPVGKLEYLEVKDLTKKSECDSSYPYKQETVVFNTHGNINEVARIMDGGYVVNIKEEYLYDSKNRLSTVVTYTDGRMHARGFKYIRDTLLHRIFEYSNDDVEGLVLEEYEYNDDNLLLKKEENIYRDGSYYNPGIHDSTIYTYYWYDGLIRLVEQLEMIPRKEEEDITLQDVWYEYSDTSIFCLMTPSRGNLADTVLTLYDLNERVIESFSVVSKDNMIYKTQSFYNDKGDLISILTFENNLLSWHYEAEFEYDSFNNWIQKDEYVSGKIISRINRSISYL